ncbi:MAG TPA: hypothetical protein VFM12_01475 [Gemmatimonadales bacterium]|jgi:hypothetical protein|nr:hypothetical protein [Gemmatimonadales bacterium]
MPTVILVIAILVALAATIAAFGAPELLAKHHHRATTICTYAAAAGVAWISLEAVSLVHFLNGIIQDPGLRPESVVQTVRTFISRADASQRIFAPPLLALMLAGTYVELLARKWARPDTTEAT